MVQEYWDLFTRINVNSAHFSKHCLPEIPIKSHPRSEFFEGVTSHSRVEFGAEGAYLHVSDADDTLSSL